jgi:hypothetical protein
MTKGPTNLSTSTSNSRVASLCGSFTPGSSVPLASENRMRTVFTSLCIVLLAGCATVQLTQIDADYVLALSTANKLLEAWRSRDQDAGLALLSPRLRKTRTEDEWRMAISGISNPHHQSYEISDGKRLPDGRVRFVVCLHDHYTGHQQAASPRQKAQHIILINVGENKWQVDGVPQL